MLFSQLLTYAPYTFFLKEKAILQRNAPEKQHYSVCQNHRTLTLSPGRTPSSSISPALCSVARDTVAPPISTGSSTATGVRAPVRPTCCTRVQVGEESSCASSTINRAIHSSPTLGCSNGPKPSFPGNNDPATPVLQRRASSWSRPKRGRLSGACI